MEVENSPITLVHQVLLEVKFHSHLLFTFTSLIFFIYFSLVGLVAQRHEVKLPSQGLIPRESYGSEPTISTSTTLWFHSLIFPCLEPISSWISFTSISYFYANKWALRKKKSPRKLSLVAWYLKVLAMTNSSFLCLV